MIDYLSEYRFCTVLHSHQKCTRVILLYWFWLAHLRTNLIPVRLSIKQGIQRRLLLWAVYSHSWGLTLLRLYLMPCIRQGSWLVSTTLCPVYARNCFAYSFSVAVSETPLTRVHISTQVFEETLYSSPDISAACPTLKFYLRNSTASTSSNSHICFNF